MSVANVRNTVVVLVTAGVVAAAITGWQATREPVHESTALLALDAAPATLAATGGRPENLIFLARRHAALGRTRPVLEAAAASAGLDLTDREVLHRTSVGVSTQDASITVRATGPTGAAATGLAQALSDALIAAVDADQQQARASRLAPLEAQIADLEATFATIPPGTPQRVAAEQQYQAYTRTLAEVQVQPVDRLQVLSPPTAAPDPVAPRPVRAGVLAFVITAAVAAQVLLGMALLRRRPDPQPDAADGSPSLGERPVPPPPGAPRTAAAPYPPPAAPPTPLPGQG